MTADFSTVLFSVETEAEHREMSRVSKRTGHLTNTELWGLVTISIIRRVLCSATHVHGHVSFNFMSSWSMMLSNCCCV